MSLPVETAYLGLASFLRLSIAGQDLRPIAQALLQEAELQDENPFLWMNMATAFFSLGEREVGLSIQAQALQMRRLYHIAAAQQPARRRLLVLAVAGDIAENTPIDCLLDGGDTDLTYYFATLQQPLPEVIPEHDAVLVALADSAANRPLLAALDKLLAGWERPVINPPARIPCTERGAASELLQGVPGLAMPLTWLVARPQLLGVVNGSQALAAVCPDCVFPVIVRPVGSQAGRDLARIEHAAALAEYLAVVPDAQFYVARFIDYSSADGLFRKFRIALIGGRPYACHMGISTNWMIHYVNAGMYDDAAKRDEEARFMDDFAAFAARHAAALTALWQRSGLDYFCIDCAETRAGELLIFEMDHVMVVHAMDPVELFPYKQVHMRKVREAFVAYVDERVRSERAASVGML